MTTAASLNLLADVVNLFLRQVFFYKTLVQYFHRRRCSGVVIVCLREWRCCVYRTRPYTSLYTKGSTPLAPSVARPAGQRQLLEHACGQQHLGPGTWLDQSPAGYCANYALTPTFGALNRGGGPCTKRCCIRRGRLTRR